MKLEVTYDAGPFVCDLVDELEPVHRAISSKFSANIKISTIFRLLSEKIGRKTSLRYEKREYTIWIDLVLSEEAFGLLKKCEQRQEMSDAYLAVISKAIRKYKISDLDPEEFLAFFERSLWEIGWRREEWEIAMEANGM